VQKGIDPLVNTPRPLELRSTLTSGALIVEAVGEIDMTTAAELIEAVEATALSTRRVVVDLSAVSFLDSSGLNALVHARRALAARDVAFCVVSPSNRVVRRVLEITQLTAELGVVESLDDALG
jgi:anti-anti-sigma factor